MNLCRVTPHYQLCYFPLKLTSIFSSAHKQNSPDENIVWNSTISSDTVIRISVTLKLCLLETLILQTNLSTADFHNCLETHRPYLSSFRSCHTRSRMPEFEDHYQNLLRRNINGGINLNLKT